MARLTPPSWQVREEIAVDLGLDKWDAYFAWTKRSYIREDGQFKAKGWLMKILPSLHSGEDEAVYHFLAD